MKLRIFAIIFFLFLSTKAYSQYLETNDINIFDAYLPVFLDSKSTGSYAYPYYLLYYLTMKSFYDIPDNALVDITKIENRIELERSIQHFSDTFEMLLNFDVPEEIEIRYNSAGWSTNGHKKFMTIMFGSICVVLERDINIIKLMLKEGFWEDEDDRIAIEENMRMYDYISERLKKIFNEIDLNILMEDTEFAVRVVNGLKP